MMLKKILYQLDAYEKLMRLDKPVGILLLLWPTLWGLWLSTDLSHPNWQVVWLFILGTLLMRSAGCVLNDLADRQFDGLVARTKNRVLVTGAVSVFEALLLGVILLAGALLVAIKLPNQSLFAWGLVGIAAILAASYPFMKRFFVLPQAYLGLAFGMGIPLACLQLQESIPVSVWCLFVANIFWVVAYDTEYAMVDRADDLKIGIKTAAILFGRFDVLAVMLCYGVFLILLLGIGIGQYYHWPYYLGLALTSVLLIFQYRLIKTRDPRRCFQAFLDNQWIGCVIFAGLALEHYLYPI